MINISVDISGLKELIAKLDQYNQEALDSIMEAALDLGADYTYLTLIAKTPVVSGKLRKSTRKTSKKGERRIGPDVTEAPYAVFVEFGHHTRSGSFVPGQFYIEQAALESVRPVTSLMISFIKANLPK